MAIFENFHFGVWKGRGLAMSNYDFHINRAWLYSKFVEFSGEFEFCNEKGGKMIFTKFGKKNEKKFFEKNFLFSIIHLLHMKYSQNDKKQPEKSIKLVKNT